MYYGNAVDGDEAVLDEVKKAVHPHAYMACIARIGTGTSASTFGMLSPIYR